ncbi:hypothetical protein QYF61_018795 [Mycteria americana]|uniref:Uncharacterized protein n=1 Tax=Mycteria americana TaxID=33587 RepID=A0AAN7S3V6_MYCAM|nr:hypothetical protein QYF61_018795 [Mycteria americana]
MILKVFSNLYDSVILCDSDFSLSIRLGTWGDPVSVFGNHNREREFVPLGKFWQKASGLERLEELGRARSSSSAWQRPGLRCARGCDAKIPEELALELKAGPPLGRAALRKGRASSKQEKLIVRPTKDFLNIESQGTRNKKQALTAVLEELSILLIESGCDISAMGRRKKAAAQEHFSSSVTLLSALRWWVSMELVREGCARDGDRLCHLGMKELILTGEKQSDTDHHTAAELRTGGHSWVHESWGCSAWGREGSRETFQYIKGAYKKDGERHFTKACSDRTRGNGFKLKEGRLRLDIRKKFLIMRVVRHWNRLPREVVDVPSLEVFKVRLDGALNNKVIAKYSGCGHPETKKARVYAKKRCTEK